MAEYVKLNMRPSDVGDVSSAIKLTGSVPKLAGSPRLRLRRCPCRNPPESGAAWTLGGGPLPVIGWANSEQP